MTAIAPLWMPTLPHIAGTSGRRRAVSPVTLIGIGNERRRGRVVEDRREQHLRIAGRFLEEVGRVRAVAELSASKPLMYDREPMLRLGTRD